MRTFQLHVQHEKFQFFAKVSIRMQWKFAWILENDAEMIICRQDNWPKLMMLFFNEITASWMGAFSARPGHARFVIVDTKNLFENCRILLLRPFQQEICFSMNDFSTHQPRKDKGA